MIDRSPTKINTIKINDFMITNVDNAIYMAEERRNPQTARCQTPNFDWQIKFEERHNEHARKVIMEYEKANRDTERVRNLKNKKLPIRSRYLHEKDYDKGITERVALERKQTTDAPKSARIYIEGRQLPKEMRAFEPGHKRCYFWG